MTYYYILLEYKGHNFCITRRAYKIRIESQRDILRLYGDDFLYKPLPSNTILIENKKAIEDLADKLREEYKTTLIDEAELTVKEFKGLIL